MKIYELHTHQKSMMVTLKASPSDILDKHPIRDKFMGQSKQPWEPIEVETLYKGKYKDFPDFFSGMIIVSQRAKQIIEPYTRNEVEFLPLIHKELDLYVVNVTNVLDCIDWDKSDVVWSDEILLRTNKLVFDIDKIPQGTYMFKFKERANLKVYVTEDFIGLIESNKLKGLGYSLEYDSEFTEEKEMEQKKRYEEALLEIERNKGKEITYDEAIEKVKQGKALASGKWKMQFDAKGRFCLGELMLDLTYQWIIPVYIPPILLGYLWHEVDKSEI